MLRERSGAVQRATREAGNAGIQGFPAARELPFFCVQKTDRLNPREAKKPVVAER